MLNHKNYHYNNYKNLFALKMKACIYRIQIVNCQASNRLSIQRPDDDKNHIPKESHNTKLLLEILRKMKY